MSTVAPQPSRFGYRATLAVSSALALGVAAVVVTAVARHLAAGGGIVLPASWCRSGSMTGLQPLTLWRLISVWHVDGVALVVLGAMTSFYLWHVARVRRRHPRNPWPLRRTASFLAGIGVCVYATNGAIAVYDMALFSAHMLGHLALVMVAPPLLVAGRPLTLLMHSVRNPWHSRVKRFARSHVVTVLTAPPVALATYAGVIVGTHLTGFMDLIMRNPWAGQLEHLLYVVVGCQFFVLVVGDEPIKWRLPMPGRWMLLALSMAIDTFTGIVLLQMTSPIAMDVPASLSTSALSDTHTGGAIMWFGGDGIMGIIMLLTVWTWSRRPEHIRRDTGGWIERARRATFSVHTGQETAADSSAVSQTFDDDESRRVAYNNWLAGLEDRQPH